MDAITNLYIQLNAGLANLYKYTKKAQCCWILICWLFHSCTYINTLNPKQSGRQVAEKKTEEILYFTHYFVNVTYQFITRETRSIRHW